MTTYLITGCGGFVGSHLTEALLARGHHVIGLDLYYPEYLDRLPSTHFQKIVGSVHDSSLIDKLIDRSDQVVHLAAIASPQAYVKNPKRTIDINLNASISIIERLRFTQKPLFFASTSEIFGKNPSIPWNETANRTLGPTDINRWCYSTSKAMIEHYLYACSQEGSISFNGVRIFNCYGPRLRGRVVDNFVSNALSANKITIHGDGNQTRCFTYITDLIRALILLLEEPCKQNKFYNIGSSVEHTINDLATTICNILNIDISSTIQYLPHSQAIGKSYEDIPRRVPDCTLAQTELGWQPSVSLTDGIKQMIEYETQNLPSSSKPQFSADTDE